MKNPQQKTQDQISILPMERDMILRIMDGNLQVGPWIYQMRAIWHTAQDIPWFEMLQYLIKERITGSEFLVWMETKQGRSPVNAVSFLRQKALKDYKKRNLFAVGRKTKY